MRDGCRHDGVKLLLCKSRIAGGQRRFHAPWPQKQRRSIYWTGDESDLRIGKDAPCIVASQFAVRVCACWSVINELADSVGSLVRRSVAIILKELETS